MNQKIKVGIIGGGAMAHEHAKAFASLPDVELAGIWNRTREKAEKIASEHGIAGVYDSIDELYTRAKPDLVVVAVYELAMRSICETCFQYPWSLLIEKPPGYNLAEASALLRAAEKAGSRAIVGLNRRFLRSTRAVLEDLRNRPGPRFIHVQDQQNLDDARAIGHAPAVVENWMFANSIHLADYLRCLGRGEITKVVPIRKWNPSKPGVVLAGIEFASGDSGLYEGIWDGPGPWAVAVSTPEVRWEMRPLEKAVFQLRGQRALNPVEPDPVDTNWKPGFRLQAEHAVRFTRGEPSDSPRLEEALATIKLIQSIFFAD